MKVTALIPAELISEVKELTAQTTTTDALIVVLREWVSQHRLKKLTEKIKKTPLQFKKGVTAKGLRVTNERRPNRR